MKTHFDSVSWGRIVWFSHLFGWFRKRNYEFCINVFLKSATFIQQSSILVIMVHGVVVQYRASWDFDDGVNCPHVFTQRSPRARYRAEEAVLGIMKHH